MNKIFLITIISFLSNQMYSQGTFHDKVFSPGELIHDLDFLIVKLEEIHPNLYGNTNKGEIDEMIQKTKAEFNKPMTRLEFAIKVIPLVTSLGDAHTSLTLPQEERTDYLKNGGLIFPFEVRINESRIFIRTNYSPDKTIAINSEILSINGIPSSSIFGEMRKYISAELEIYRDVRVEKDFRRLLWYLYDFGNIFTLTISHNGLTHEMKIEGLSLNDFENIIKEGASANSKPFSFYRLNGNIGVIDFRSMIQKKKFKIFLDSVFNVVKNDTINNLIIDIRRNGGGNSQLAEMLINYITDHPYTMTEQMDVKVSREAKKSLRKTYLKWYLYPIVYPIALFHPQGRLYLYSKSGKTKTFKENKLKSPIREKLKFKGKTFLLTSNYTFSSANMLAAAYKCYHMGTIIGEETGGVLTAYGDLIRFQLPNTKLTSFCSHKRFIHPCHDSTRHGVKPDIEIGSTLGDIQNGTDTVIEFVKSSIAKSH